MIRARLQHIEIALPSGTVTNEDLASDGWSADKIEAKTGIKSRHVAGENEYSSDLAVAAATKLFASGACSASDIDFVLLCAQSPDYLLPTTACLVQNRLGIATTAGALDFNLGCSGYVYGLSLARGLIETSQARAILLLTAETYSKFLNPGDRSVRTIFGDAASATFVHATESGGDGTIEQFVFGTDGSGAANLIVPTSGMREQKTPESARAETDANGNVRSRNDLYMDGPEVFAFTLREVPKAVNALLTKIGATLDDIELFVFHQANTFMLEHLRKKMKLPSEKFWVSMQDVGNTVSATIPIALHRAVAAGRLERGGRVMLVGFGVGYSWAACTIVYGS